MSEANTSSTLCCGDELKLRRLHGGGESWYYLMCSCVRGKVYDASHQDDKLGMKTLREKMEQHNILIGGE